MQINVREACLFRPAVRNCGNLARPISFHLGRIIMTDRKPTNRKPTMGPPLVVTAIAGISLGTLLLVDHGPWSKPKVQPAQIVLYSDTAAAAKAAGAVVTPTAPKAALEPTAPGPKPVQPAIPDQGGG
jgi:hypothetical protein